MENYIFDFKVIKFFGINTRSSKVLRPLLVRWEFPSLDWVKINTEWAARDILVLLLVEVFFVRVFIFSFLCVS